MVKLQYHFPLFSHSFASVVILKCVFLRLLLAGDREISSRVALVSVLMNMITCM